jgi:hypothetical protein
MESCWQMKPSRRPTFVDIIKDLEDELSDKFRQVSFYFNPDPLPAPAPEADGAGVDDNMEETAADDESQVNHLSSLLHSEPRPENTLSSYPMENARSSPKKPVDRLTLGPSEGNSVPGVFVDSSVTGAYGGVSERLLGGVPSGVAVQAVTECNHDTYADSHKGVAYSKNRLTNGHIPYQSMSPSDGHMVRV